MSDPEIDRLFDRAADANPEIDPALLDRVAQSIGSPIPAVRPLAPAWLLTGGLLLLCAALALAGGMILGPHGILKMNAIDIAAIFPALVLLLGLAASLSAAESAPGSRRPIAPWLLGVCGCLLLAIVFGALFRDYHTERFVAQGMACLTAGLAQAVPAAAGAWWILRRGFAVNSQAAGFARGALAGLAGVTMLEIHCPNFETLHVIVWHIAVLPIAGLAGMLLARFQLVPRRR
jgi:hypothetical protein